MPSEEYFTTIFRAYKTLMDMLGDRGYVIADEHRNMTLEQLKIKMRGQGAEGEEGNTNVHASVSCDNLNQLYRKNVDLNQMEDPEMEGNSNQNSIAVFWCCDEEKEKVNSDMVKRVQIQSQCLEVRRAIMIIWE